MLENGFSSNQPIPVPFDFTLAMRRLCEDIAQRSNDFRHIRTDEVAITFAQTRCKVSYGLQAKLTPMRFENGRLETQRAGRTWTVQRLFDKDEREILYILTFYLPRFLNHSFREKLITVFHELYHISPLFDGDLRRMNGRYYAHSHSQKNYDRLMEEFVDHYLASNPPRERYAFLKKKFRTLLAQYGSVVGMQIPVPKLIPVPVSKSA